MVNRSSSFPVSGVQWAPWKPFHGFQVVKWSPTPQERDWSKSQKDAQPRIGSTSSLKNWSSPPTFITGGNWGPGFGPTRRQELRKLSGLERGPGRQGAERRSLRLKSHLCQRVVWDTQPCNSFSGELSGPLFGSVHGRPFGISCFGHQSRSQTANFSHERFSKRFFGMGEMQLVSSSPQWRRSRVTLGGSGVLTLKKSIF